MDEYVYKKSKVALRGFTLLELLISMTIIIILAGIIYGLLERQKRGGSDAGVQQNLVNARSQINLFYTNNNNTYVGACTNTTIRRMVQTAARTAAITPNPLAYSNTDVGSWNAEACHESSSAFAVWVPLRDSTSGTAVAWCVDSANASKRVSGAGLTLASGATVCP